MGFLGKGNRVSFIFSQKTRELVLSPDFVVLHDVEGNFAHLGIRGCDFFIVGIQAVLGPISHSNTFMREKAQEYNGSLDDLVDAAVDLLRDDWEHDRDVEMIRYTREGHLKENYEHLYVEPQPLYVNQGCYKIVAPDGCIASAAGFEWP